LPGASAGDIKSANGNLVGAAGSGCKLQFAGEGAAARGIVVAGNDAPGAARGKDSNPSVKPGQSTRRKFKIS
jgi:hypothetical protein